MTNESEEISNRLVFQVTLEEQMICGALQTLNEEACEDVLDVPSPAMVPSDSLSGEPPSLLHSLPLVIVQEPPQPDQTCDVVLEYSTNL